MNAVMVTSAAIARSNILFLPTKMLAASHPKICHEDNRFARAKAHNLYKMYGSTPTSLVARCVLAAANQSLPTEPAPTLDDRSHLALRNDRLLNLMEISTSYLQLWLLWLGRVCKDRTR
jgi:hypothetical protein